MAGFKTFLAELRYEVPTSIIQVRRPWHPTCRRSGRIARRRCDAVRNVEAYVSVGIEAMGSSFKERAFPVTEFLPRTGQVFESFLL